MTAPAHDPSEPDAPDGAPGSSFLPPPRPTAAELLRKWIFYRHNGHRIHKGFVQSVRGGGVLLEIAGSVQPTGYPLYLPYLAVEIVLFQTVEEEAAERAKADPGPRSPHSLIIYPL